MLWLELARGTLGSVAKSGAGYSVALRGLGEMLGQAAAPATSPTCRARLAMRSARSTWRARRVVAPLAEVTGERVRFAGLGAGLYGFGTVRWLTGPCAGIAQMIVDQDGDDLFLAEPPPLAATPGMRALVTQGCDKRLATCAEAIRQCRQFSR